MIEEIASALRSLAIIFSVLIISYGGIILITSKDPVRRNEWKEILTGVFIGLSLIFIAPLISFAGGGYCGG